MEKENFIENLATRLGQNATVKNVFGEPVITDGKTIIPVAQVAFGFGGGLGLNNNKKKNKTLSSTGAEDIKDQKGVGGGGGMYAKARGVYEISSQGTRFIPANNTKQLLIAALFGFLIRGWLLSRRNIRR